MKVGMIKTNLYRLSAYEFQEFVPGFLAFEENSGECAGGCDCV
jgi:hypothetical protein